LGLAKPVPHKLFEELSLQLLGATFTRVN